jgi:hypothetical protein
MKTTSENNKLLTIPVLFFFWAIFLGFSQLNAQQFSKDFWHLGEVDLFAGETYRGKIKYDLEKDNLQIQLETGTMKSFSAQKVEAYQIFDGLVQTNRYFYTLPYEKVQGYSTPTFFELLTDGRLDLLNREVIVQQVVTDYFFYRTWTRTVQVQQDAYYFLDYQEKVHKFEGDWETLIRLMDDKREQVHRFAEQNALNLRKREDLIKLVDFYNSFFPKEE